MKKCPFCAEEIQDEATICRFCSRAQPQGLRKIEQRGTRFALGSDTQWRWSVWDLQSGQWIAGWPGTQEGWKSAWARYTSLEQSPAQSATPLPNARPQSATSSSSSKGGGVLGALLLIGLLIYFFSKVGGSDGSGGGFGGSSHTVLYNVTGAFSATMTFQTASQDSSQQIDVSVPWSDTETMSDGDFYYISAQNNDGGTIVCSVLVDGAIIDTNSSSGDYAICTASGSV